MHLLHFYRNHFLQKNKKSSLFTKDSKTKGVLVNLDYQKIFNYIPQDYIPITTGDPEVDKVINNPGILYTVDKYDIDEVLFVKALYRASRTQLKISSRVRWRISRKN